MTFSKPRQVLPANLFEVAGHIASEVPHDIVIIELTHREHLQITQVRIHIGIIKINERMADSINSLLHILLSRCIIGKHLLHQLQLNQIFQINTDLRP